MSSRHSVRRSTKAGAPPGTLMHIGSRKTDVVTITVIDYNKDNFTERECEVKELGQYNNAETITWINVDGLHNIDVLKEIGDQFELDKLLLEDVLNTNHRPKTEIFDDHIFVTLKMISLTTASRSVITEQVSFIMGDNWIISFQEAGGDVFDSIRDRLRKGATDMRKRKVDFLLYRMLDVVVDNYFFVTEYFSDKNGELEQGIFKNPTPGALKEIQLLKRQILNFKRAVLPLREVASGLQKDGGHFIEESTLRYLRDLYEHIIQVNDSIDSQREMAANNMDLFLSGTNHRMNEIMKVLTVISTIFIPLTFIAGVYGMNFDRSSPYNMPELGWKFGYLIIWGIMISVFAGLVIYFRRKKWF
jgi:magnesium transporter